MSHRPITEDDLQGYVDHALAPERHAEVAAYLARHPAVARRIAALCDQRDLLRAALAPIAAEPIPRSLDLSRIIEGRRRRTSKAWAAAAILLVSIGIGAIGGWVARGSLQTPPGGLFALAHDAADTYSVYAPDRVRPVELRASDSAEFVQWVSDRLHRPINVPDLITSGYRLMGGRLVATSHGAAVMVMYDDDRGSRIVVLMRPMNDADQNAPMTAQSHGNISSFAWADGGVGYSLVGEAPRDSLKSVANDVRKQARAA